MGLKRAGRHAVVACLLGTASASCLQNLAFTAPHQAPLRFGNGAGVRAFCAGRQHSLSSWPRRAAPGMAKSACACEARPGGGEAETETYLESGGGVKVLVSGLTGLVNAVMRRDGEIPEERPERQAITVGGLRDGIQGDYERCYLWTGDIDPDLYDWDCVFTDPTLSFKGLKTFQRNLANLRPIIDTVIDDYKVDLYSCEEVQGEAKISARWRMYGRLRLPWKPAIDLKGKTVFTYAQDKGNRIVDYFESWETPAATVLLNLLRPAEAESSP